MKNVIYVLILPLVLMSGSVFAKPETKTVLNNWRATADGVKFTQWEASPTGKKIHAGAIKINRAIRGNSSLEGVVTSRTLPEGSRVGYGFMVKIGGVDYMLAFGAEANKEFDGLRGLQVNDKIIIKSHHVSKAPKYTYPILAATFVVQDQKLIYKRELNKGGC